jgi:hypothetical protein
MTIERPMFPPRADSVSSTPDTSRRAFLVKAAAAAAGGAAVGMALPLPESAAGAGLTHIQATDAIPPRLRRPVLTLDGSGAGDELRSAFRVLDDAHEALKTAWAEYRRVADLARDWERQHPYSGGGSNRAYRKRERHRSRYSNEINWRPVSQAYYEAREDFEEAKRDAALVKVRDLNELALKAAAVYAYEDTREGHLRSITPVISVSVAIDLAKMALPEGAAA